MKIILHVFVLILFFGCKEKQTDLSNIKNITVNIPDLEINKIEDLFSIKDTINLEATPSSLISTVSQVFFVNDKIFISDLLNDKVLCFSNEGRFIRNIGNKGRAANEFLGLSSFYILGDTLCLYDFGGKKVLRFDIDGNYLDNTPLLGVYNSLSPRINNDGFIAFNTFTNNEDNPKFTWLDENYKPLHRSKDQLTSTSTFLYSFSLGENSVIHWEMMDDTIYSINNDVNSKFYIDFQGYAFPKELDIDQKFEYYSQNANKTAGLIDNVVETNKYLAFTFSHNFHTYWAVVDKGDFSVKMIDFGKFNSHEGIKNVLAYKDDCFIGICESGKDHMNENPSIVRFY